MATLQRFALSLKQPWATLVVHGLKTIEVRRWPTARRGPILIHAARIADDRPEAWAHVLPRLKEETALRGGIIGSVELSRCVTYENLDEFLRDRDRHLNEESWFEPPRLYGFVFRDPHTLPFRRYPGWFKFFTVNEHETPKRKRS
jgi:hypothetical protein